jgi:RNA polymerase sigma-70 factor, ECF subfamily
VLELDGSRSVDVAPAVLDRDELERGFRELTLEHRAVFVLHHYVGLSMGEVAETLGIPAGTARSRLHYATEALRRAMARDAAETTSRERPA